MTFRSAKFAFVDEEGQPVVDGQRGLAALILERPDGSEVPIFANDQTMLRRGVDAVFVGDVDVDPPDELALGVLSNESPIALAGHDSDLRLVKLTRQMLEAVDAGTFTPGRAE